MSAADTADLLDRHRRDVTGATDALVARACDRLRHLTSRMLGGYPGVSRWEQTDDVLQGALIRLCRALGAMTPESPKHFYNLAALQIRRVLLDLAAHYQGPHGTGANHHTDSTGGQLKGRSAAEGEPETVAEWAEFHQHVERLPDEDREVFGLLWYQGLTQDEAAEVLGISLRTVKRRWQAARLALAAMCPGAEVGEEV